MLARPRAALFAGLVLLGCTARHAGGVRGQSEGTVTPTAPMSTTDPTTSSPPLPPIDRDAPAAFATATFALG